MRKSGRVLGEESGAEKNQESASPPVGVGGGSIVEGRAAFTVSLIDASPGSHQRDGALVAAIGGCILSGSPKRRYKTRNMYFITSHFETILDSHTVLKI